MSKPAHPFATSFLHHCFQQGLHPANANSLLIKAAAERRLEGRVERDPITSPILFQLGRQAIHGFSAL